MNYMLIVIGVILGIVIFIVSLITGVDCSVWIQDKIKTAPTITFNNFKELYQITPDKWCFKLDRVSYNHEPIEFKSYFDIIKYRRFKKQVEKEIRREDGTYYEISQSVLAPSEEEAKALIKAVYSDVEIHHLFTKEIKED